MIPTFTAPSVILVAKLQFGESAFKVRVVVPAEGVRVEELIESIEKHGSDFRKWDCESGALRVNARCVGNWVTTVTESPSQIPAAQKAEVAINAKMMVVQTSPSKIEHKDIHFAD